MVWSEITTEVMGEGTHHTSMISESGHPTVVSSHFSSSNSIMFPSFSKTLQPGHSKSCLIPSSPDMT